MRVKKSPSCKSNDRHFRQRSMNCYHGTLDTTAKQLALGCITVSRGGGELGAGFYAGDFLWVAKTWAANRHGGQGAVLKLGLDDKSFFDLQPLLLSKTDAILNRNAIRVKAATRTYLFGANVVWSPIVGTTRVDADQYKFETTKAELLINGPTVTRTVV